jgi:hypothetical protein
MEKFVKLVVGRFLICASSPESVGEFWFWEGSGLGHSARSLLVNSPCLVKRSQALRGRNLTRDNQVRAGECSRRVWGVSRPKPSSNKTQHSFALPFLKKSCLVSSRILVKTCFGANDFDEWSERSRHRSHAACYSSVSPKGGSLISFCSLEPVYTSGREVIPKGEQTRLRCGSMDRLRAVRCRCSWRSAETVPSF